MAITEYVAKMDPATQHLHEEMVRQQSVLNAEVSRRASPRSRVALRVPLSVIGHRSLSPR